MQETRVIAPIAAIRILFVVGYFVWYTALNKIGLFDEQAVRRIEFIGWHHRDDGWVKYKHDTWLRANAFHISSSVDKETYYVLTEEGR